MKLRFRAPGSLVLAALLLVLVGCGSASNKDAVEACKTEVLSKIEGKMGELDERDMLSNARALDDGSIQVDSTIVYRRGTDQESEQTFNCTVASDDSGRHTRVIRMTINW